MKPDQRAAILLRRSFFATLMNQATQSWRRWRERAARRRCESDALHVDSLERRLLLDGEVEVVDRHLFYDASAFDGFEAGPGVADDLAIATDKRALLPGETATFENWSSYARGINGVMVDITGLADPTALTADDFVLRVGNDNAPGTWQPAPTPTSVTVRPGAGVDGSDRVTLTFADNAIERQWLEVTVLPANDTFYFGSAIGEVGNEPGTSAAVTPADADLIRNNQTSLFTQVPIDNPYDIDRDRRVTLSDVDQARVNLTGRGDALNLISPPPVTVIDELLFTIPNVAALSVADIVFTPGRDSDGLVARGTASGLDLLGNLTGIDATEAVDEVMLFDEDGDASTIEAFELSGNAFTIPTFDLTIAGTTLLKTEGVQIDIERLSNRATTDAGRVAVLFNRAEILPGAGGGVGDGVFSASAEYIGGAIDLDTGAFDFSALRLDANIGALTVNGSAVRVTIDPNDEAPDAQLVSIGKGSVSFPDYPDLPDVALEGLTIRRDGVSIDDFAVNFGEG
ncbi:MAG: hypothetical protein AAF743_17500, partial [Planctomycetota bacterium]